MYIVAIAWLYVTLMMAVTEKNLVAGAMTFVFYGVLPLALVLWLFGGPRRRLRKTGEVASPAGAGTAMGEETEAHAGVQSDNALEANRASRSVPHDNVQQPDRPDAERDQ